MYRYYKINIITILTMLSFATITPGLALAAPLATSAEDWQFTNGNSWAWSYSPETQINRNNVQNLEVKWIFPMEAKSQALSGMQAVALNEGSTTPPLVKDGKVFVTTNYLRTYGIDAKTGKLEWVHNYEIDVEESMERLPIILGWAAGAMAILNAHLHGIRYWEGGNALLINGMACDFYGIDIDTGKTSLHVKDLCLDVPGNIYAYRQCTASSDGVATYEKGRQFIFVLPGAMHSNIYSGDARHVTMGIDMDTHQILWRVFSYPPQDIPTKDWALQECDIGFFRDIPCTEVAATAPENLEWDWAEPGETPSVFGGVTAVWGATPVVDEDTGIMYMQTGNQGPFTYIGATPGPRLYGSTFMAIDLEEGKRIWWLQPMPRDPYDYDCCWDGILVDDPILGKVYVKGCKEGRLFVMDAMTGEPIYTKDVIAEQIEWGQVSPAAAKEPYEGGIRYHLMDPFSYYDMREMEAPDGSIYCPEPPCEVYPAWLNGIFATDMAYDPETGTLYHYAATQQASLIESPPAEEGKSVSVSIFGAVTNTTIVARDLATGDVKWTWFYPISFQRSHMVVTPEILFTGFTDGYLRFFDKYTGELLHKIMLGSALRVGLTTGQDTEGNQMIFTISGVGPSAFNAIMPTNPGTVIALGPSERAAAEVRTTTVTTTSATTVTTTTATTRTVTTTTATTSTSISTVPPSTTTITSEVTETVGLPTEYTYAAVAVAVIAIIAAAVLATRRRA